MTAGARVSLLMPVHNRAHLLDQVLERLAENTTYANFELIAVDDGSTDGSTDLLRRWAAGDRLPEMRLIENPNQGAIASLNTALRAATGEFCVQLDDDVTIETRGWIERMLELMTFDELVGVVTAKVVFDWGEIHTCGVDIMVPEGWHERGAWPTEPAGRRQLIGRTANHLREGSGGTLESEIAEVDAGMGACMMYRRDDALAVGGYDDEWSPVWFDDADLCLKIRTLGKKAFYLPDVRVIHHFRGRRDPERLARLRPRRVLNAVVRRTLGRLPFRLRRAIENHWDLDLQVLYTKPQRALLRHHHEYWRQRWGWDPRNPDMDEIERRWAGTEICWRSDPVRRAAGEQIARAFEARRRETAVPAA